MLLVLGVQRGELASQALKRATAQALITSDWSSCSVNCPSRHIHADGGGRAAAQAKHGLVLAVEQIGRHAVVQRAIGKHTIARDQGPVADAVRGSQQDLRGVVRHHDIVVIDVMRRDRERALLARQARPRIRHRVMAQAAGLAEILVALYQRQPPS